MDSCNVHPRFDKGPRASKPRSVSSSSSRGSILTRSLDEVSETSLKLTGSIPSAEVGSFVSIPFVLAFDADADIVTVAFRYTRYICLDSTSQSSLESCNMHRESIQRYRIPSWRVIVMASRKLLGSEPNGNSTRNVSILSHVNTGVILPPQQWLRATYSALFPCEQIKRGESPAS